MSRLRLLITAIVLFAFAACGGASRAPAPRLPANTAAQLEALACPEGVDSALWMELKAALEEALHTKSILSTPGSPARLLSSTEDSRAEARRTGGWANHGRDARATKITATPPAGAANQIDDLTLADNGDGTYTLSWHYRNLGDYDQDGVVALEDIIPLAEHFGEAVPEDDAEGNSLQAVIDGSGNGRVRIEDITPIAQHFQTDVHHYLIEGAESSEGPWELVSEVQQDTGTGDGRLIYEHILSGAVSLWHRVVPYDAEGNPGEPSNAVLRPSSEPIIYDVTPTSGYQHEEYTFSATVTGAAPLAYAWDFGGGASPDAFSDISPTVTLADAGEYEATLSVTNAYGEASFPFTLGVRERDMWAHTWGGSGTESLSSLAVDSTGALWVAGFTNSFGSGESDVLLLKYNGTGAVEWAKTWGGEGYESACSVELTSDNGLLVAGTTTSYGVDYDDILVLKYRTDGELIWARTWGTAAYERATAMAVDGDGNIYVCGSYLEWGGKDNVLLCKFDAEGEIQWAATWGGSDYDYAVDVSITSGGVVVAGDTASFGAGKYDAFVAKFSSNGLFEWAWTYGGEESDTFQGVLVQAGIIYVTGNTRSFGAGSRDALLMALEADGAFLWARTWGTIASEGVSVLVAGNDGLTTIGSSDVHPGGGWDILLLRFGFAGDLRSSSTWGAPDVDDTSSALAVTDSGDLYVCGVAESAGGQWQSIEGVLGIPVLQVASAEGVVNAVSGLGGLVEGIESTPIGVTDIGGGGKDVLLLKNHTR